MGFSCGFIGLPNVGKSTIFNSLTSAKAAAANFPFCTIEPNTGAVPVPDPRLDVLAKLARSEKIIPTQMTFVDIAGLIRGASKGEGLGNQFLGHIRSVDAVAHVVRCFEDDDVIHVEGKIDPVSDIETINTELVLADLDSVEKQMFKYQKAAKTGDKEQKMVVGLLEELQTHLGKGNPARTFTCEERARELIEKPVLSNLLTGKPTLYVANVAEELLGASPDSARTDALGAVAKYAETHGSGVVIISGKVESELAELAGDERLAFLEDMGVAQSGLDRLALAGHSLLHLITSFTAGPKETRAWTIETGTKAPQAAGVIHSDFERGFIRAETISYTDYVSAGGEVKAREQGKLRTEGKEYVVQDGDIMHFRFNV